MSDSQNDPKQVGKWDIIKLQFKHLPVHISLMHTGEILAFGGSGNEKEMEGKWYLPEIFTPDYTGNTDGQIKEISDSGIDGDLFCAGHAYLPDGRLFIAGGTYRYDGIFGLELPFPPFSGLEQSYIFDPTDYSWTRIDNMKHGRWYPTCVMLANGDVTTFAGLTKWPPWLFLNHNEVCSKNEDGKYKWQHLKKANKFLPLYPRIHLMPNGELFYSGSYNTHMTFPFTLYGFHRGTLRPGEKGWKDIQSPKNMHRQEGTSVLMPLYPPYDKWKVMLMGGGNTVGGEVTKTTEIVEFDSQNGFITSYQSEKDKQMNYERYFVYAVILPDQNIFVAGGKSGHAGHHHDKMECIDEKTNNPIHTTDAVNVAEIYNTKEDYWKPVAEMTVDRLYHSNAILLPDGRVMTAGSNPARKCYEKRIEMYSPPYLFRGERPKITKNPDHIKYNESFEIELTDAGSIKSIVLIRPSNTTHCLNPEQRYVGLDFERKNNNGNFSLSVKVPANKNVAPPGYYMLFILNHEGVPNVAPFVLLS